MNCSIPVLAIDGPSGAGKGTVSRAIANTLSWRFLDSGAIYRSLAVCILQGKVPIDDQSAVADAAEYLQVSFGVKDEFLVFLDGNDITDQLSMESCSNTASRIAAYPKVREMLLQKQREFRRSPGLVADGRDMGTVVFPDAPYKIYLTASSNIRAQRRYKQLKEKGMDVSLLQITKQLEERDRRDKSRACAPLQKAEDAIVIDSTELTVEQVIERSVALLQI